MINSRPRVVGLLLLLAAVGTGCSGTAEAASEDAGPVAVAVPSYAAAADVPGYCATLAASTHLTRIPSAVGVLAGGPGDAEARFNLTAAIDELQAVRDGVRGAGG